MTSDKKILSWVNGYKIPFKIPPYQNVPFIEPNYSSKEREIISNKITELIVKGAVVECTTVKGQFLSPVFVLPKPDGSYRMILNLKKLNEFVDSEHFKLENFKTVLNLMEKDCFMTSLDIKDAYYSLPIDKSHRKFLRFQFDGKLFEFTCLVFGLNVAPCVFTKLLKPVICLLRELGFYSVIYLDDFLLLAKSFLRCSENFRLTRNLLENLGFILNEEKCKPIPSQRCLYLGFLFDSKNMTLELPDHKRLIIMNLINKFKKLSHCKIRDFAQFIGSIIACCPAMEYGWLYSKSFEREKWLALMNNNNDYESKMNLNLNLSDLNWWQNNILLSKKIIERNTFVMEIFTDASLSGWGAVYNNEKAHGFWTNQEKQNHINFLELKAAFFGLKCFAKFKKDCRILLRIDNTTAIAYINKMGGIQFEHLNDITKLIWQWCEARKIIIFASYIKSKDNFEADAESRKLEPETEYELSDYAFNLIVKKFGHPEIDLFASQSNKKCERYFSWKRDPGSEQIDAFTVSWSDLNFYAFPPFSIILKMLRKIEREKAEGLVVLPNWPGQPWYPLFRSLLSSELIIFEPNKFLLFSCNREPHPLWENLSLVVGKLSARP